MSLALLHGGVILAEHDVHIPWLITRPELFRLVPRERFTTSPAGWPMLETTVLGIHAKFGFNFVSHPEHLLAELQAAVRDRDLEASFAITSTRLREALGEPDRQSVRSVRQLVWQDDLVRVESRLVAEHHCSRLSREPYHYVSVKRHVKSACGAPVPPTSAPPPRSHRTVLGDSELLLLDFLFDKAGAPLSALSRDRYRIHMNCNYSHRLDDDDLARTMAGLCRRGLVMTSPCPYGGATGYRMTRDGGRLWESERGADWSRYCRDSRFRPGDDDGGDERLEVLCARRDVGLEFARVARDCGVYRADLDGIVWTTADGGELADWRDDLTAHQLSTRIEPPECREHEGFDTDWAAYERRRTWWRNLGELLDLPPE